MIPRLRFNAEDAQRAFDEWGANCGPGAIAAICGMSLDDVRPHMGDFETKHYTNPTLMYRVLDRIGVNWSKGRAGWPEFGLVRIQWEGPWSEPGAHHMAGQRQTHWVGCHITDRGTGIFDINAIGNGTGWCSLENWERIMVPYLTDLDPGATGKWHITHAINVEHPDE